MKPMPATNAGIACNQFQARQKDVTCVTCKKIVQPVESLGKHAIGEKRGKTRVSQVTFRLGFPLTGKETSTFAWQTIARLY